MSARVFLKRIVATLMVGIGVSAHASTQRSPSGGYRIAGTVMSAASGHPLARAQVTIADTRNRQDTQTITSSDDGRFEFQVAAGKFSLQASKRGFITSAFNQHDQFSTAIVTGVGLDTEHLPLRLSPAAVLAGKIIDEAGEPVRQAVVTLYREDRLAGVGRIRPFNRETTDDQGAFEFAPLDSATYFVSVTAKPWYAVHPFTSQENKSAGLVDDSLDVAYPTTYYGDTTESDDATPVPVRGGDHVDIEIHLTPAPSLHLLYHANSSLFSVPVLQKSAFDGMETVQTDGMQQISSGVFEITGVPPGRYNVRTPGVGMVPGPSDVDLTSNGQELTASEEAASSIKLTLQLPGGATPPPQLQVALRRIKGRVAAASVANEKGEVEFADIAPGNYSIVAATASKPYSVARIVSPGGSVSGNALNVPPNAALSLTVALVAGEANVEGIAKRDAKPFPGAMIVLVPLDPENHRELFRRDQSDLDGTFTLRGVVPGTYTILAIEDGWDLDWAKPGVIARYSKSGQEVVVKENVTGTVHASDAVVVQRK